MVLFLALIGGATNTSLDVALDHPAKLETWLTQSGLYTDFVKLVVTQAGTAASGNLSTSGVSFNDAAVRQIAESVFSPPILQQYVSTFLDANYSWLEGKTSTPNFTINLTASKEAFAQQVGQYVTNHLSSLPICTPSELISGETALASGTSDPLQLSCRPSSLNPISTGALVSQQIASSHALLGNTVITQKTFQPNHTTNSRPYYVQFSSAPKLYQLSTKLPFALVIIALLCMVAIFFMSVTKRRGMRHIGFVLLDAGVVLTLTSISVDASFTVLKQHVFSKTSNGPLQQGLTNFLQHVETQINEVTLGFGIAFILLALIILIALLMSRKRSSRLSYATADPETKDRALANSVPSENQTPAASKAVPAQPVTPTPIPKAKRSRLIQ